MNRNIEVNPHPSSKYSREEVIELLDSLGSCSALAIHLGVSRARVYQVLKQLNIDPPKKINKGTLSPKQVWLNKRLLTKKVSKKERMRILEHLDIPDSCPILKIPLDYGPKDEMSCWDGSHPSLDQIEPRGGYYLENIQVLSLRANVIKYNASIEELEAVLAHLKKDDLDT